MSVQAAPTRSEDRARPAVRGSRGAAWRHAPLALAVLTALLRLPFLRTPLSPDEGGFLLVGAGWHRGTSLYGDLWVDRPPLLVALFRVADLLGGQAHALTVLRLVGCVAAAAVVLLVGLAAREVAVPATPGPATGSTTATSRPASPRGARADAAASAVAAVLLVSVWGGATVVNGELLAAPFIALGVWASLRAARSTGPRWALLAGASGAAAVLVKQNMLDVAVFLVVLLLAQGLADRQWGRAARRAGAALLGGFLATAAVLLPAWAAGTTPWGVFEAMYPFRLAAAKVMNTTAEERVDHGLAMVGTWALSASPLLLVGFALWALRRAWRDPRMVALLVLLAFDGVSIAAGGSFWLHYVVQLVVPTALAAAVLVARVPGLGRALTALVLAAGLVGWGVGLTSRTTAEGDTVGRAVAGVARPSDTIISLLGDADVVRTTGLRSPYPYLWSIPARTLDPGFTDLARLVASPDRPTWVVVRGPQTLRLMLDSHVGLPEHYRRVATICAHPVLLRSDVSRPVPRALGGCRQPLVRLDGPAPTSPTTAYAGPAPTLLPNGATP